ncbi:MYND-type zinc finger-containing chromatin reader ZMYND8-like isoform X2 [Bolinopsis microptera]|uniref:MYND-type zinc finger-containing chromatin reader ZMYND8-like isoform X2 n=1 Tax=Bolinopsis microptera TaxID=2820187 RepID=UPI00307ACF5D
MHLKQNKDQSIFSSSPGEMEVDVEDSPTTSPAKQNGMVVEVAGPVVIQYKDKKNREKDKKMKNDCYCWICHHTGNMLCCERCPRVFHMKCVPLSEEPDDDWICPCCAHLEECKKLGDRSKCCRTNLAKMLPYALDRMSSSGTEAFQQPVTTEVAPNYFDFVHYPMDMGTIRQKAKAGVWQCTQHFLDNSRWILHNCIIFNGGKSRLTALARTVYNVCQHEMLEISLCPDCFLNSCTADKDWFTRPCKKTHRLVWAKLRGFPFWPAKVLQRQGQQIDVRFFGQHERAWVHESNTLDISEEPPAGNRNKEAGSNRVQAEEEMNRYVENLKKAGRWPIDLSKVKDEVDQDDQDEERSEKGNSENTANSAPRKKKKDKAPVKEPVSKAPKLKISSNSLLKDERISNAFKFEDSELKGTPPVKADRPPQPSGKRRKTDDKIKIEIEPDRMKFNKQKLAFKKSTSYSNLVNNSTSAPSDNIVEKVFSVTSNGCNAWKYQNKLMEAISGMVEEMLEETKQKYKTEAEKAVELAKMAAELEKETFKLEVKRDNKCRSCKSKSSSENSSRHEEELRTSMEEQRVQLEAEKDRQIEELRQHLTAEKEKAIVETKKSQWCANCSGPAMYHCCWNTSYCGYPCQRGHWPQHMYKCEQQNSSRNLTTKPRNIPPIPTSNLYHNTAPHSPHPRHPNSPGQQKPTLNLMTTQDGQMSEMVLARRAPAQFPSQIPIYNSSSLHHIQPSNMFNQNIVSHPAPLHNQFPHSSWYKKQSSCRMAAQAGQMDGMVLARQAPSQIPGSPSEQIAHEHINSRPD